MAFVLSGRATAHYRLQQLGQQQPQARRSVVAHARTPTYYDLLGVEPDASPDEIKAAYRKRAKELHPDVNDSTDADAEFKAAKVAYETLSDAEARAAYDASHSLRRMNFFRDVDEDGEGSSGSRRQQRDGWGRPADPQQDDPFEIHRRMWTSDEPQPASTSGRDGEDAPRYQDPEELLERLSRFMNGGLASPYGGGRLDPFGSTSSDAWARRVQQQTDNPGLGSRGSRPLYGGGGRQQPGGPPSEWDPFRPGDGDDMFEQRQGWSNPARPEWQAPGRRRWDEEDDDDGRRGGGGLGGGRPGRRGGGGGLGGGGGDGGFRGKPL